MTHMIGDKTDILSMSADELKEVLETRFGMKGFRAGQIYSWLYKPEARPDFAKMSDIPKADQKILGENFHIGKLNIIKKRISADGTVKYLFELYDGDMIESVFMRYNHGNTVCISTQAGCRMGCVFCASGAGGLSRNLLPSEMLLQVLAAGQDTKERISNVVLMGIGEPLDNFENVVKFLELVNCKQGLNIGYRHISLSTCGLVEKIRKLGELNIPITLSVSLHASDDETRKKIMPAARKWKTDDLLQACREYANLTKRRISFEYALMDKINDSKEDAHKLALKIKNILCHVNLIPINEVPGKEFKPPNGAKAEIFRKTLEAHGINATFRRKCGKDIDASCGQLKHEQI